MGWLPQVNGHVQVMYLDATVPSIKIHPGIITAVVNPTTQTVNVRVGRSGQTFAALIRRFDPAVDVYPCYVP